MTDDAGPDTPAPQTPDSPPPRRAGRCPHAIALFLLVAAGTLATDLVLKQWSFAGVVKDHQGNPVRVELDDLAAADPAAFWQRYPHEPIVVVPHVLNLHLTTNPGAVFGLGRGGRFIFILVSIVATAVIGTMFYRSPRTSSFLHAALALILAGALGNLYDRIRFGCVRDMLHMLPDTNLWPWIFNPADVALVVGVGMILLLTAAADLKHRREKRAAESAPD